MKHLTILITILILTIQVISADNNKEKVIATFNNNNITVQDIHNEFSNFFNSEEMSGRTFETLDKKVQENLITTYIITHLLDKEIEKSDIKKSDTFKEQSQILLQNLARNLFLLENTENQITSKMIDELYNKIILDFKGKKTIKVRHILTLDKKTALTVKSKLNAGNNFSDVAKQYSTDESTKDKGGDLGEFQQGELEKEFENQAYSMSSGEISEPFKTKAGWHVILLEEIKASSPPSRQELEPKIRSSLIQKLQSEYINNMVKNANIKMLLDK